MLISHSSHDVMAYRPVIGRNLETNNETTAVAMQQRGKHASTTTELLLKTVLCNPLLGSCNSWTTTMKTGLFSMWSMPGSYGGHF
jgi:hypothetical protein